MLIADQLRQNDPPLRALTLAVAVGLLVLLAGLWWVQIVRWKDFSARLEIQSVRTVRVPAVRGKILDRNGVALAENRPGFSVGLYLEELSPQFRAEYQRLRPVQVTTNRLPRWKAWLGFDAVRTQYVRLSRAELEALAWVARARVVSNAVAQIHQGLAQTPVFDEARFRQHYRTRLALPYPVLTGLATEQVARFEEQALAPVGADLEIQSLRIYPFQTTAAHVLGYLTRDDRSYPGEEASFSYRLPDYCGVVGIEGGFDPVLRGRAGVKSVLVNNLGYKQGEEIWSPAQPGQNVVLTLDLRVQQAAERALRRAGPNTRGAAVVMDVRNGDILAMASSPAPDPNHFVHGFPPGEYERLNNEALRPQVNRATQEHYAPGSIFKVVVGLACLENGLDPRAVYAVQPDPANPTRGCIFVGRQKKRDTAPPGDYDFRRALLRSSNSYFITNGLRRGVLPRVITLGQRLHLGQRFGLPTRQEAPGDFPSPRQASSPAWRDGDTANLCIGQGPIAVTPLQMAVVTCAIANGGVVFWPRLVQRLEPQESDFAHTAQEFPAARERDRLGVSARNLRILHDAMLADTEDPEGTGRAAAVPGLRVCGKTGTAQVTDAQNRLVGHNAWFISFAPYESPRYAVVVLVEDGASGGATCAPIAREIYLALQQLPANPGGTLAALN